MNSKKIITGISVAMFATGALRADMMPAVAYDGGPRQGDGFCVSPAVPSLALSESFESPCLGDITSLPFGHLPAESAEAEPPVQTTEVPILQDKQESLSLCLYGMMSVALCGSASWIRKFSSGVLPEWYHEGGPFQIGHSHAVSPDYLRTASGSCFVQPHSPSGKFLPSQCLGIAVPQWWRLAQFSHTSVASRAPPRVSWTKTIELFK
jgi:hypothetical protein